MLIYKEYFTDFEDVQEFPAEMVDHSENMVLGSE